MKLSNIKLATLQAIFSYFFGNACILSILSFIQKNRTF